MPPNVSQDLQNQYRVRISKTMHLKTRSDKMKSRTRNATVLKGRDDPYSSLQKPCVSRVDPVQRLLHRRNGEICVAGRTETFHIYLKSAEFFFRNALLNSNLSIKTIRKKRIGSEFLTKCPSMPLTKMCWLTFWNIGKLHRKRHSISVG